MRKIIMSSVCALSILALTGCGLVEQNAVVTPPPSDRPVYAFDEVSFPYISGSAAVEPLAEAVVASLLGTSRENAEPYINFGDTSASWTSLIAGESDIVLAPSPDAVTLEALGSDFIMTAIATDALVFYVDAGNPVQSVTLEQLEDIFSGEIEDWSELGGRYTEINPCIKPEGSASRTVFDHLFDMDTTEYSENTFAGDSGSISYASYEYAVDMGMASGKRILAISDVSPTQDSIADGTYPLVFEYVAAISANLDSESPEGEATALLYEWLGSSRGKLFIEAEGYTATTTTTATTATTAGGEGA